MARVLAALAFACFAGPAFAQRGGGAMLPGSNSRAPISVNAEKLDYFDKEQKLVYTGAVVAKQGDSTLRSSALTIFMASAEGGQTGGGPGAGQVKRMEAAGPVTITSKDQVGQGDHAIYDKGENKVYLFGNVSLTQGTNVIKGAKDAKLVYDLDSGRARIDGGVMSMFTPGSGTPGPAKPVARTPPKPAPPQKPKTARPGAPPE
jgi:lipopolysaccharide export system protein LptA